MILLIDMFKHDTIELRGTSGFEITFYFCHVERLIFGEMALG